MEKLNEFKERLNKINDLYNYLLINKNSYFKENGTINDNTPEELKIISCREFKIFFNEKEISCFGDYFEKYFNTETLEGKENFDYILKQMNYIIERF